VLAWLSIWSEVQTCIWPSWCHCHSLSLASVKSRLVLTFWYRLTWVVLDKGSLNVCVCAPVWWQVWVQSFFLFHCLAVLCCERPAKYSSNYFFLVPDCCVVTRVPRMSKSQKRDQNLGICLAMLLYPVPMSVGAKGIFEHSSHQHSMQMVVLICRLWLLITGWIQTWNTQGFLWAWKTRGNSVQPQGKIVTNKSSFSSSFKYLVTVLWWPVMSLELMWNDPWWRSLLHVLFVAIT